MKSDIDKIVAEINKKFGDHTIGRVTDMPLVDIKRISSGSPYVDWALGGGWPLGRTIELYGPFSSGKTLVALRTVAEAQKKGLTCVYFDAENTFDKEFATKIGVKMDELILSTVSNGEQLFNMIEKILGSNVAIIVVDSVAGLVPTYEEENEMEKQTIGLHARLMSKGLRKITAKAAQNQTLVMFVNQIREKPTMYGNPNITTGGRALGFYSSIRMEVNRGEILVDGNKKPIGQEVKFKVTKSKVSAPYKDGYFIFYHFDKMNPRPELFDKADELVSMLLLNGKITRRGGYYDILGQTFQGKEALLEEIRKNKPFQEKLLKL